MLLMTPAKHGVTTIVVLFSLGPYFSPPALVLDKASIAAIYYSHSIPITGPLCRAMRSFQHFRQVRVLLRFTSPAASAAPTTALIHPRKHHSMHSGKRYSRKCQTAAKLVMEVRDRCLWLVGGGFAHFLPFRWCRPGWFVTARSGVEMSPITSSS